MEVWVDEELRQPRASRVIGNSSAGGGRLSMGKPSSDPFGPRLRLPSLWDDKENVDPRGFVHGRSAPRSPLPSWYPRQPLQDITALVNAFQAVQVDAGKKAPKPKLDACYASALEASLGSSRYSFTKPKNRRPAVPVHSHAPKDNVALRMHFR